MARMTQSQVRQMFIKAYPGVRLPGKKGYWYRCAHCGKWCGRAGGEKANIPENQKMEVDHIIPWSKAYGGADQIGNLQALCHTCNRKKSNNQSGFETAKGVIGIATHGGNLMSLAGGAVISDITHKMGIKVKRK